MINKKPQMVTCDVNTLKVFLKHMQPLNDKISGLKVKIKLLEDKIQELEKENLRLEKENIQLASKITELNHENEYLKKKYASMPNDDEEDFDG